MEYILEELSSHTQLKGITDFMLRENENGDNKFYLIRTKYGNLGITFYNLGMKPCIISPNNILFMGFGTSIIIYNIIQKELLYKISDAMHIVYEVHYNIIFDIIIVVCELCILAFNSNGLLLWENGFQEPIYDYSIGEQIIEIRFEDSSILSLSIKDGNVKLVKK